MNDRRSVNISKEPEAHPRPLLTTTRNETVTWYCRTDGWLLMKWHINCNLVIVQPMKLSKTGLLSIKPVYNETQSNSQNFTKRNVWASANGFWIAMMLKVTTWKESSWEMKHGSTINSQRVNTRVWNGDILIRSPRKSLKHIQPQKSLCLQFFGTHKAYYWTQSREGSIVKSARFSEMLCGMIKTAIRSKRTGPLSVGVVL